MRTHIRQHTLKAGKQITKQLKKSIIALAKNSRPSARLTLRRMDGLLKKLHVRAKQMAKANWKIRH
jgi:hypothetical protein